MALRWPGHLGSGRTMSLISRSVSACVGILLWTLLASASAREFRVADTQAENYPTVQALQFMARLVEERSGGRHWLRVFHSRRLGEEQEKIQQQRTARTHTV